MPDVSKPPTGTDLAVYRGSLLAQIHEWTTLPDDELRRRAVQAAGEKDAGALVSLTTAYLSHKGKSGVLVSPHTITAYQLGVRQFLGWATDQAVNLLRPGRHDGQNYVGALLAANRAPAGVALRVAAAGALYKALRWAGATEALPFQDVTVPTDPTPGVVKRPPYSEDELFELLRVTDVQNTFLLLLLAHGGLRISEALALSWSDVDAGAHRLTVIAGKGRKGRIVAMTGSLVRAYRAYHTAYGPSGTQHQDGNRSTPPEAVFRFRDPETARYHLSKAFREAGVTFRGFHPGRKYAGTRLYSQVKDFGRVAAHLGHASVDTTRKGYAATPVDDLKDDLAGW